MTSSFVLIKDSGRRLGLCWSCSHLCPWAPLVESNSTRCNPLHLHQSGNMGSKLIIGSSFSDFSKKESMVIEQINSDRLQIFVIFRVFLVTWIKSPYLAPGVQMGMFRPLHGAWGGCNSICVSETGPERSELMWNLWTITALLYWSIFICKVQMILSIPLAISSYNPFLLMKLKHSLQQRIEDGHASSAWPWSSVAGRLTAPPPVVLFLPLLLPRGFPSGFFWLDPPG